MERLAAALGGPVDSRLWAILEHEGHTSVSNAGEFRSLVAQARFYRRLLGSVAADSARRVRTGRRVRPDDWRAKAIALAKDVAGEEGRSEDVIAFRRDVLKGRLLTEGQARRFIRTRSGGPVAERVLLAFPGENGWVARIMADRSSVLGQLWAIGERLQRRRGWHDYAAVWFVLTGKTPLPWPVVVDDVYVDGHLVAIRLAAAPWLPGRVVLDTFLRLQRKVGKARSRPLSDRRRALLQFAAEHPKGSYRDQLALWNKQSRPWSYPDVRGFVRDLKAARRQMDVSAFRLDHAWD